MFIVMSNYSLAYAEMQDHSPPQFHNPLIVFVLPWLRTARRSAYDELGPQVLRK